MIPERLEKPATEVLLHFGVDCSGGSKGRKVRGWGALAVGIYVPLKSQRVLGGKGGVRAETAAQTVPAIAVRAADGGLQTFFVEILGIGTIADGFPELSAILNGRKFPMGSATSQDNHGALRVAGFFGDDIDHAVDGVRSPDRAAGTTDHLYPRNVLQGKVERVPIHPAEGREINGAAIHHDQQFVAEKTVQAAGADRPRIGINLGDVHTGDHAQKIGNVRGSGPLNIIWSNHKDSSGRFGERLSLAGNGGDLDVHEVLDVHCGEVRGLC